MLKRRIYWFRECKDVSIALREAKFETSLQMLEHKLTRSTK